MLLLGIIHADLKNGGPLAAQKGHNGGRASCAPFQAVDTATPVLGPEEVVAVVTQAKSMVQLRTLIHNLGMEKRLPRSWETSGGASGRSGGSQCFVHSYVHGLGVGLVFPISLEAPKGAHREVSDPEPSKALMGSLPTLLSWADSCSFITLQHTCTCARTRTHRVVSRQPGSIHSFLHPPHICQDLLR